MQTLEDVTIYTDGACLGNPGPGGYGTVVLCEGGRMELSGGYRWTTNNRMEMMAAIVGLQALKRRSRVTVYSDSEYMVKAITRGWAQRWRTNGWRRNRRERALNPDLWEMLLELCKHHEVDFRWVKGHSDSTENIRCDELATQAARHVSLLEDVGYISQSTDDHTARVADM